MWKNVKNLQNHLVGRRFHNETKPWETFHCALLLIKSPTCWLSLQSKGSWWSNCHRQERRHKQSEQKCFCPHAHVLFDMQSLFEMAILQSSLSSLAKMMWCILWKNHFQKGSNERQRWILEKKIKVAWRYFENYLTKWEKWALLFSFERCRSFSNLLWSKAFDDVSSNLAKDKSTWTESPNALSLAKSELTSSKAFAWSTFDKRAASSKMKSDADFSKLVN